MMSPDVTWMNFDRVIKVHIVTLTRFEEYLNMLQFDFNELWGVIKRKQCDFNEL